MFLFRNKKNDLCIILLSRALALSDQNEAPELLAS